MSDHNVKLAGDFQNLVGQCLITDCYFQQLNCNVCRIGFNFVVDSLLKTGWLPAQWEPPPLEVRPSPFQAENAIFVLLSKKKKKAEKTPKKKLPDNNLKVSMPTIFTSLKFLKTQTSFRSFFNYKSGNIVFI